jgi:hypothetical protein
MAARASGILGMAGVAFLAALAPLGARALPPMLMPPTDRLIVGAAAEVAPVAPPPRP